MNRIRHNSPSPIHCLRAFHTLFFAYLLSRCYCYHHYKIPKTLLLLLLPLSPLSYYFATKYFVADIKFPGVVELTTQLLIFESILWLPLCRINKFGLNTLPSKAIAIPYTCGSSVTMEIMTMLWRWRSKAQDDDCHIMSHILIACDVYLLYILFCLVRR